jgi:capsular exopolysaccharide synthesis family protein
MNEITQASAGADSRWLRSSLSAVPGFGIREILAVVRRHKWGIVGTALGGTLLAGLVLPLITPRYTAQTLVMIEGRAHNIIKLESVVAGLPGDAETVEGEMHVLGSRQLAHKVMVKLGLYRDPEFKGAPGIASEMDLGDEQRSEVIDRLIKRLRVSQKGRSRAIAVEFTSVDPPKAALVSNTFAELYLIEQMESKFRATQSAAAWLDERVAELRGKVAASEQAVEEFRARSGLLQGETLRSDMIQQLRAKEVEVQRQLAELSTEYGERHPRMLNLRAEAASLHQKIQSEVRLNAAQVPLRALEREADSSRLLLNTFLARLKETSAQQDISVQQPDARIISRADVPLRPSFPKALPILALSLAGSTLTGLLVAFVSDHLDRGFRSAEELEEVTGATALGLTPIANVATKGATPVVNVLTNPKSAFTESIRTLSWTANVSSSDAPPKKILVTSAEPGEGKTTIAVCLARIQALADKKVLVVDADSRRPAVAKALGAHDGPGLTELLLEEATLKQVVWKDERTGLDMIRAGKAPHDVPSLLASPRMDALLETLSGRYDVIVIDSPPVMVAADARVLSTKVDGTILVVRWASTPRDVVNAALRQLHAAGGRFTGTLLNMVDLKKYAPYGYGDSGYYHERLRGYYTEDTVHARASPPDQPANRSIGLLRWLWSFSRRY